MEKLTIKLTNSNSPLSKDVLPDDGLIKIIEIDGYDDHESVFEEVQKFIETVEDYKDSIIIIKVLRENNSIYIDGSYNHGSFSGVKIT